jgi:hypothetical protein
MDLRKNSIHMDLRLRPFINTNTHTHAHTHTYTLQIPIGQLLVDAVTYAYSMSPSLRATQDNGPQNEIGFHDNGHEETTSKGAQGAGDAGGRQWARDRERGERIEHGVDAQDSGRVGVRVGVGRKEREEEHAHLAVPALLTGNGFVTDSEFVTERTCKAERVTGSGFVRETERMTGDGFVIRSGSGVGMGGHHQEEQGGGAGGRGGGAEAIGEGKCQGVERSLEMALPYTRVQQSQELFVAASRSHFQYSLETERSRAHLEPFTELTLPLALRKPSAPSIRIARGGGDDRELLGDTLAGEREGGGLDGNLGRVTPSRLKQYRVDWTLSAEVPPKQYAVVNEAFC